MNNTVWRIAILALGISLALEGVVNGIPITVEISGHVTSASGSSLPSSITPGVTFAGFYTYDSVPANSSSSMNFSKYVYNSPYGIEALINGAEFSTVRNHIGQFEIAITNAVVNYDWYEIKSSANIAVNGTSIQQILWKLGGPGKTISSMDLPLSEPAVRAELTYWTINTFEVSGQNLLIQGIVTNVAIIPEPATLLLLGLGGLLIRRKN